MSGAGGCAPTPPSRTSALRGSGPPTRPRISFLWGPCEVSSRPERSSPHAPAGIGSRTAAHRGRALRSPLPWRERVRVRGLPEVTRGVPVRSPRAQGSDAAAHRRSRISEPRSPATPATVLADHRMPLGVRGLPPEAARPGPGPVFRHRLPSKVSPALARRAAARSPLTPALSRKGRGSRRVSRRPVGDPGGGVGAPPPQKEHPRAGGWAGAALRGIPASTEAACARSSGMGAWRAAPPTAGARSPVSAWCTEEPCGHA